MRRERGGRRRVQKLYLLHVRECGDKGKGGADAKEDQGQDLVRPHRLAVVAEMNQCGQILRSGNKQGTDERKVSFLCLCVYTCGRERE